MTTPHSTAPGGGVTASPPGADGFDLYRLDCAVDALRDVTLSHNDRAELARISQNLNDLMEATNGHAH